MRERERGNWEASYNYVTKQNVNVDMTILDVGCNVGTLVSKLIEAGFRTTYGIDINRGAIEHGKKARPGLEGNLRVYDGCTIPFGDGYFDVVMSFDVIEHIPDVHGHFDEVRRVLKAGGLYIFQTPNKLLNVPWEVLQQKSLTKWRTFHGSLQTPWSLKQKIAQAGFELRSFDKQNLCTEYNLKKVERQFGPIGAPLLRLFNKAPIIMFPHMWCVVQKTDVMPSRLSE